MTLLAPRACSTEPPCSADIEDGQRRELSGFFSARELMALDLPEPRWVVPGLIPEGLTVLAGAPKVGKSWVCLDLALAVASGGRAFGLVDVEQGGVLYVALEDTPRRLQGRLVHLLRGEDAPTSLELITELPSMPDAIAKLDEWLSNEASPRLVIVDVLGKIRGAAHGGRYDEDYSTIGALKELADKHRVGLVVVHHTRKQRDSKDDLNDVSGSTGLTGAADTILVLHRSRRTDEAKLKVTGRDVEEQEQPLSWSPDSCRWELLAPTPVADPLSPNERRIFEHLTTTGSDTAIGIVACTGLLEGSVKSGLNRLGSKGFTSRDGRGRHFPVEPATPATPEPAPFQGSGVPCSLSGTAAESLHLPPEPGSTMGSSGLKHVRTDSDDARPADQLAETWRTA